MLTMFVVERSFQKTTVRAYVEPQKRRCGLTIARNKRIVRMGDESDPTFRSFTAAQFGDPQHWDREVGRIAESWDNHPTS